MSVKARITTRITLRRNDEAVKELSIPVLEALVKGAQRIVSYAVKSHPYTDRTGHNTRSIGYAISPYGTRSFGSLTTGGGSSESVPDSISSDSRQPSVLIAGTSGYSGWLEIGTTRMKAFPYILPAYKANVAGIMRSLKDII